MERKLLAWVVHLLLTLQAAQAYKLRVTHAGREASELSHNCCNTAREPLAPTLRRWPARTQHSRKAGSVSNDALPQLYLLEEQQQSEDWDDDSSPNAEVGEAQLLQLFQQLTQQTAATEDFADAEAMEQLLFEIDDDDEDDERSSKKRPWRKVQRIIRRQLVKLPKRYLKKFLKTVGLKKYVRSSGTAARSTLLALPTQAAQRPTVQEVGILLRGRKSALQLVGAHTNGRFADERLALLRAQQ